MTQVPPGVLVALQRHLGLTPESVGGRTLANAVGARMTALGLTDPLAYELRLATVANELQKLAEAVVVHETWFFRYPDSFRLLSTLAAERMKAGRPVRVLSIPCSTGEEVYSAAIALAEAGVPPAAGQVVGVDVSEAALRTAEKGLYGPMAFREPSYPVSAVYCTVSSAGRTVQTYVTQRVKYRAGNLAAPLFLSDESPFPFIFCRNLFIYLSTEARHRALINLQRLLTDDGVLFVGHAESFVLSGTSFRTAGPPSAFAYTRKTVRQDDLSQQVARSSTIINPPVRNVAAPQPQASFSPAPSAARPNDLLAAARTAADAGRRLEAIELVERHLKTVGPSAEAYTLLGVLHLSAGEQPAAGRAFDQALYLNPKHYDSLIHQLALAEARGDAAAAANYRRRAAAAEGDA